MNTLECSSNKSEQSTVTALANFVGHLRAEETWGVDEALLAILGLH